MADAIKIFIPILIITLILSFFMPVLYKWTTTIDSATGNIDSLSSKIDNTDDGFSAAKVLISILFWDTGLPAGFNIFLIVIRIIGLFALYYIGFPTK